MTDIFHPATPVLYVQKLFKAMAENPKHTFMVLTKRPEQLHMMNDSLYFAENIWLGVSVEDRKRIERLDVLRKVDTPNRFVSFEPLLEEIRKPNMKGIKWAIIGGESGPYARRCNYNWIYKLAIDCRQSGSKIFIKQLGNQEAMICECSNRKGAEPSEWPFALREALKPNREFPDGMVI
jgi:protein gp37